MSYMILVPLLPLLAVIVIGVAGSVLRERSVRIAVPAVVAAFAGAVATLVLVTLNGPISVRFYEPSTAGLSVLSLGFYIDRLSAVMMVLITGVSAIVHLYSIRYMQGERGYARFYSLLGFITSVLLCLVSSANLLMLLVCWQLVSWLLYLLLAYNYAHPPAVQTAFKTWVVLRLGDVAFLAGVLLTYAAYGTLEFPQLFERAAERAVTFSFWARGLEVNAATTITLLLFVGAMAKSAQFPLHVWLPATMDTPTPVSALMHAGIVNAGGFLINRLAPLYGVAPGTLHVAFVIGGLTAIVAAAIMLTKSDIKTMLGFSTMGQMGYMTMECGLGAFALAIFHLIAHGIFKATLFLYAGNVIHEARQDPRFPPVRIPEEAEVFPHLPWATGVVMTLLLPLIILLAAHGVLHVPLRDAQGAVIFLFFAWVTSAQAILSLYRLRAVGSWKVAGVMVFTVFLVIGTYLWAAESFTYFLYPAPGEAARYFEAAAFPLWLFDLFVVTVTVLIIGGWAVVYTNARGEHVLIPRWTLALMSRLYVWVWNRLYVDTVYARLGQALARLARRVDAALPEWLP
ncbi:MAG: NADH-quinone oxidoreductase subunit 5 family protein [Nitrospiraceae bacterium]